MYHFDLYRLKEARELETLGSEEFFYDEGISVIEWADKLGSFRPPERLDIYLKHKSTNERLITLQAQGARYQEIMKQF